MLCRIFHCMHACSIVRGWKLLHPICRRLICCLQECAELVTKLLCIAPSLGLNSGLLPLVSSLENLCFKEDPPPAQIVRHPRASLPFLHALTSFLNAWMLAPICCKPCKYKYYSASCLSCSQIVHPLLPMLPGFRLMTSSPGYTEIMSFFCGSLVG